MNSKYLLESYCDYFSNDKEDKDDYDKEDKDYYDKEDKDYYDKEDKATLPSEGGGWDGPAYPRCRRCCKHFSHDQDDGVFDDKSH